MHSPNDEEKWPVFHECEIRPYAERAEKKKNTEDEHDDSFALAW